MPKQPWDAFATARSQSFVSGLVEAARPVSATDLVDMSSYRREDRMRACSGHDPLSTLVAYAQDELIYSENGRITKEADRSTYLTLPRRRKVNIFGLAYRPDAKLWLHKTLADIVVGAATHLYITQGWTTVLYDGLRTMEGHYNLYLYAPDSDISSGLLALPGQSAHNKGLAVDSMMYDKSGVEIDMGGHFDHVDMETNSRPYAGKSITAAAKQNRLLREAAFLRSAFAQGLLVAPLRNEFWDDRLPENRGDLWRVLDSAARCLGISLLTQADEDLRRNNRAVFREIWEDWRYSDFIVRWRATFKGHDKELGETLGVTLPPLEEKPEFYHGNYQPIFDRDLRESGKHLTEEPKAA